MARKKRKKSPSKPIGITNITKTAGKRLKTKMGYALVFGTKTKPRLGRTRFKKKSMAQQAFRKRV